MQERTSTDLGAQGGATTMRERPRVTGQGSAEFGQSAERTTTEVSDATETLLLFRTDMEREAERREREEARLTRRRGIRRLVPYLPLLPVLAVQSYFAVRLMNGRTASVEEAGDLFAGHMEIGHLLHGAPASNYPTFFSGAPVLYPVAGALIDSAHGLFAARCLSLFFMLLATIAVFRAGRRVYGMPAGLAAATLFSVLGPTLHLSSYATFDALALCLIAWSLYHTMSFAHGDSRNALIYAVGLMVLADCVKYAVLLWNPIIIGLVGVAGPGWSAWKVSRSWNVQRFALLSGTVLGVALLVGREPYFTGLTRTVKLAVYSNLIRGNVLSNVTTWIGPLLILALVGLLTLIWAARTDRAVFGPRAGTAVLLLLGGLAGPLYELCVNTTLSLDKQVDIGAVFAAVPAGWLFARAAQTARQPRTLTAALTAVLAFSAAVPLGIDGVAQGTALANAWPDSAEMISVLRPLVHRGTANYLTEDAMVPAYYIGSRVSWTQWHDTTSCAWSRNGTTLTGAAACKAAIQADYYSVIVLDYAETPKLDAAIYPAISPAGYRLQGSYTAPTSVGTRTFYVWALTRTS